MTYILKKKFFWLVFIIFNLLLFQSIYFSPYFYFLSLLLLVFNILPLLSFYYHYKTINYIPLYYFTHIYFFCCYTLAIFFPEFVNSIFDNKTFRITFSSTQAFSSKIMQNKLFIDALEIYLLALVFFNLGNFVVSKMLTKKIKQKSFFDFNDKYNELLFLGILSYFGSSIFLFFDNFEFLKKVYQIKYPLIYLSILSIQIYLIFKKSLNIFYKIILYFFIFIILYIEILDGSVSKTFLYLIAIYLVNFIITKKINFKIIISIVVISFFIHTFKYEYRNVTWGSENLNNTLDNYEYAKEQSLKEQDLLDKSKNFIKTYYQGLLKFDLENVFTSNSNFLKRNFSRLTHSFQSLLIVTTLSPERIPYWEGYSYKILITKFVPRIFWENKPSDTFGNEFGVRYKVLSDYNSTTSWNMPVLNEFYVNFGIIGIVLGMFFLGALYNLVSLNLNYSHNNYLFLISFITLYPLFYLESHLSLTFGAVVQTFLFLYLIIFLFKKSLLIIKKSS